MVEDVKNKKKMDKLEENIEKLKKNQSKDFNMLRDAIFAMAKQNADLKQKCEELENMIKKQKNTEQQNVLKDMKQATTSLNACVACEATKSM